MHSPVNPHVENILLIVIIQLIAIILASRIFGSLFRRIGQPLVCGEIAAGLILGPSLFGRFFPELSHSIFNPSVGPIFSIMSQLGLVLLMFLIGLEFDFGHLKMHGSTAASISLTGMLLPFGLGFSLGSFMHGALGLQGSWVNFSLFIGTAMSITAIPILGRIMIDLNINRTRLGALTISAAALDDAMGWIMLALVTAIARSTFQPAKLSVMIVEVIAFVAFLALVVRPLARRWQKALFAQTGGAPALSLNGLAAILLMLFVCAIATNLIGIFSIFGAFAFGAILHDFDELRGAVRAKLSDFITVFFLPIFFTYTGLRTDIGSMEGNGQWILALLVMACAMVGKLGGCTLAARFGGMPWRESMMIGVMMNTRALMELIVINVGFDLGIIPKSVYFMLVLMAVVTTFMTTPLLTRLIRRSEVAGEFAVSPFVMAFSSKRVSQQALTAASRPTAL